MDIKHKHMEANLMGTTFNDVTKEPSFQMHRYVQCDLLIPALKILNGRITIIKSIK
jgi:hypothetical protein